MKGVTLQQLRVFTTVAKHLAFGKAADELCVTQPAVSMQIRELERAVGLPLFDREGRRVSLTTPGEYFLVYARRILATLKDAEDAMARMGGIEYGRLTVGLVSTAKYFLPRLIGQFLIEHPGIDLQLAVGNRKTLVEMIQRNEVDLAVMGRPPRELSTRVEPFAPHPSVIIVSSDHPLNNHERLSPAVLVNERFIVREEGSGTRAAMEKFFRGHNLRPAYAMEISSNEAIKHAVAANLGISFLSIHTLKLELQAGMLKILDVEGMPVVGCWHVVHALSKTLSPAAEALRYYLIEHGERFLDSEFHDLYPSRMKASA
ncbi:MAG: LysR substrate-binding domain-containing protein [Pseudomonadota bacterium]